MNKEGKWCTVKFKYEKLGTFCFVCGVMGHAENKCEIRFSMEQDDGTREWSTEIRADSRRQGGRFVSRWLKEEKSGDVEQYGGASEPTRSPGEIPRTSNTVDDVAEGLDSNIHNGQGSNHAVILGRQQQSFALIGGKAPQSSILSQQHSEPIQNLISQTNPLPITAFPAFISSSNPSQTVPTLSLSHSNNHINSFPNINSPIILPQPVTENNNTQSFTHQLLTFTSQANNQDPPNSHHRTTRHTRAAQKINLTRPSNPNPISNPPQNQLKKPKTIIPKNPTQAQPVHAAATETMTDVELQTEKKRRREEDNSTNNEISNDQMHFLTAGPGSQACRDQ
jgi:hypothetical protein